jgi:hypothetical protein
VNHEHRPHRAALEDPHLDILRTTAEREQAAALPIRQGQNLIFAC